MVESVLLHIGLCRSYQVEYRSGSHQYSLDYADVGVKYKNLSLCLKRRFYVNHFFMPKEDFTPIISLST